MNKDNISLEEKAGQWDFDSNWSYVRLFKWSKKDKNGNVKRYTLTGKITPDESLPMFTVSILSDEKDYAHVVMHEDFNNLASFLVFIKNHMKDFPGLTDELLNTFIKYRREQSRMDESIDLDKKYGDSETLENGWTLSYDGYQAKLERADRLDNGSVKRYEIAINTHPKRLEEWVANYFTNIWDESTSMNSQEYGYRSNNLFDLVREVNKTMDKFPGLTKEMFNKLIKLSEEAKKHTKQKLSQEEKESIEIRNNKWFLNDNEKNHIFLAKDINAYEGNKHVVLRIVLEAFPSNKKDINDQYKLKIYKINYADGTNEIVTSKEFTDLLDFTTFMYRNLSTYNVEKEDIDLLISKCKENSVNKKEDIMTEESGFSDGWKLKKKFGDNYENRYPQLHLEYDDVKDPDNRLYYRLQINIDYFDDKGQDPFIVSRTKANDLSIQTYDYEHFDNPINFMNYMKNHLEEYPNLTLEDVKKLIKMSYDYLKDYRKDNSEGKKSFNNIFLYNTQESIEDYLSEGLEEVTLDETTLKDLLMAAGVLGLTGAGIYQGTQELNKMFPVNEPEINQQKVDTLKVPNYKDMPDIWKGISKPQVAQKVSVDNKKPEVTKKAEPKKQNTTKKVEPKKPETKKSTSTKKPETKAKTKAKWTTEIWKDANGKELSLDSALDYVVDHEKFREKAYRDGFTRDKNGKKIARYSIGFGTMAPNNKPNDTITFEQAKKAMIDHVKKWILPKFKHMTFASQNQFNSALSFTYNTGKIPPLNNEGNIDWDRFTSYNVFKGKVNSGLERRRNAEFYNAQLFDEI